MHRVAIVASWLLPLAGCGASLFGDGGPANLRIETSGSTTDVPAHSYSSANAAADNPTIPSEGPEHDIEDRTVETEVSRQGLDLRWVAASPGVMSLGAPRSGRFRLVPPTTPVTYEVWVHGTDGDDSRVTASFVFRWIVPAG